MFSFDKLVGIVEKIDDTLVIRTVGTHTAKVFKDLAAQYMQDNNMYAPDFQIRY